MKFYENSLNDIAITLSSDLNVGLSNREAKKRLAKDGKNIIYDLSKHDLRKVVSRLLFDPVSLILIISAFICYSFISLASSLFIISIWAINVIFTIFAYSKAENIFSSIKSYGIPKAIVKRDGKCYRIDSRLLVVGDIIYLNQGDIVPCDAKIISSNNLTVYERDLTGIEELSKKYPSDDLGAIRLSDMHGRVFACTSIISGNAIAIVTATSDETVIVSTAGPVPISGKHSPQLFFKIKAICRRWGLVVSIISIMIFFSKVLLATPYIFNTYLFVISIMGASMTESLLPLSQIAAARELSYAASNGKKDRVIIKNIGAIEKLRDISIFVATREIADFENMFLLSELKQKSVKAIICSDYANAFSIATKYGAPVIRSIDEIKDDSHLFIYISENNDDNLKLINDLKSRGECVGVLTTSIESIRMLVSADVAFTYGKFKYKTGKYDKTQIDSFSGQGSQILMRLSDVICEENLSSTKRSVDCSRSIYSVILLSASYLLISQTLKLLFSLVSIFSDFDIINPYQILFLGMICDFATLFFIVFLDNKSIKRIPKLHPLLIFIKSIAVFLTGVTVLHLLYSTAIITLNVLSSLVTISLLFFSAAFVIFSTSIKQGSNIKKLIIYIVFLLLLGSILYYIPSIRTLLSLNINITTLILGILLSFLYQLTISVCDRIHVYVKEIERTL